MQGAAPGLAGPRRGAARMPASGTDGGKPGGFVGVGRCRGCG